MGIDTNKETACGNCIALYKGKCSARECYGRLTAFDIGYDDTPDSRADTYKMLHDLIAEINSTK